MEWIVAGFIVVAGCLYDSIWFYPICVLVIVTALFV